METETTDETGVETSEEQMNIVVQTPEVESVEAPVPEEGIEITGEDQILLHSGAIVETADGQNAVFSLEEFIHYHIEETKLQRNYIDYYSRIYAIQHKRAEILAHIYEDFFKNDKSFRYRELIEDLNEDLNNIIMESPQNYEIITGDVNVDLVLGENNQFRFVEDSSVILSENHRRIAKSKTPVILQNKSIKRRAPVETTMVQITLSCPACGIPCESTSFLHNHIQEIHFDNPLVVCSHNDCEEAFYIQDIKEHENDYHPEMGEICELCNTTFRSKSQLLEHVKEHMLGNASFSCDFPNCSYTNPNPSKMIEHKSAVHKVHFKKFNRCPVPACGKSFPDNSSFQAHVATHSEKISTLRFPCTIQGCKASFSRRRFLDAHKEKHALKGEEIIEEPENDENLNYSDIDYNETYMEDKSFDRNYNGSAELFEVRDTVDDQGNSQREVFLCVNKGQSNEGIHAMANTPGVFDFICGEKTLTNFCDLCNLNFDKMEDMVSHLKTRHHQYTIRGYKCDQCTYVTHFRSLLGKHKNSAHGGKYKCEYCGKLSKDSGNHNRHKMIHRNVVYRCTAEGCNAMYKSQKAFNIHHLSHTNQQPTYSCDYAGCKYTSHYQNAVTVHKLTHTDQRNFVCPYETCRKGFKRNGDLNKHINHSHKGEKRSYKAKKRRMVDGAVLYRCSWSGCGYTTSGSDDLHEHEAEKHIESTFSECKVEAVDAETAVEN